MLNSRADHREAHGDFPDSPQAGPYGEFPWRVAAAVAPSPCGCRVLPLLGKPLRALAGSGRMIRAALPGGGAGAVVTGVSMAAVNNLPSVSSGNQVWPDAVGGRNARTRRLPVDHASGCSQVEESQDETLYSLLRTSLMTVVRLPREAVMARSIVETATHEGEVPLVPSRPNTGPKRLRCTSFSLAVALTGGHQPARTAARSPGEHLITGHHGCRPGGPPIRTAPGGRQFADTEPGTNSESRSRSARRPCRCRWACHSRARSMTRGDHADRRIRRSGGPIPTRSDDDD